MKTNISFLIISRPLFVSMRNVSDKSCRENQNTHFILNKLFYFENRAIYEIMWKDIAQWGRPQMRVWRMFMSREVPKSTNTHSRNM